MPKPAASDSVLDNNFAYVDCKYLVIIESTLHVYLHKEVIPEYMGPL